METQKVAPAKKAGSGEAGKKQKKAKDAKAAGKKSKMEPKEDL
jgi:hypothetical protein